MSDNGSMPAYPLEQSSIGSGYSGLTKRELIAAMCLQGMLANPELYRRSEANLVKKDIANFYCICAVEQADALLTELSKTP